MKVSPWRTSSTKSMSQPKMSARFTAVWSWAPAASTASNSELSITPCTVRVRVSSGFCSTSALRVRLASRETRRVWVSFRRRSRP